MRSRKEGTNVEYRPLHVHNALVVLDFEMRSKTLQTEWTESPERYGGVANRYGLNEDEVVYCARKPESTTASSAVP